MTASQDAAEHVAAMGSQTRANINPATCDAPKITAEAQQSSWQRHLHESPKKTQRRSSRTSQKSPKRNHDGTRKLYAGPHEWPRSWFTRPETGSLRHILRQHSGESLIVYPMCWTDTHARLLGAHFHELERVTTPVPDGQPSDIYRQPTEVARTLTRELGQLLSTKHKPLTRARSIKAIMAILFPETLHKVKSNAEMDIHVGQKRYHKVVKVPALWKGNNRMGDSFDSAMTRPVGLLDPICACTNSDGGVQSSISQPLLAYIGHSHLAHIRRNLYRVVPGPGGAVNQPVTRLQQLRCKMLLPSNVDHDSHFVAIFIAMAQAHFYPKRTARSPSQEPLKDEESSEPDAPNFHDVRVQLITHADDTSELVVYKGVVTAKLLRLFAYPNRVPDDGDEKPGLDISFARVNAWPVIGLRERLGKVLGPQIMTGREGMDPDFIDNYNMLVLPEQVPETEPEPQSPSRISTPSHVKSPCAAQAVRSPERENIVTPPRSQSPPSFASERSPISRTATPPSVQSPKTLQAVQSPSLFRSPSSPRVPSPRPVSVPSLQPIPSPVKDSADTASELQFSSIIQSSLPAQSPIESVHMKVSQQTLKRRVRVDSDDPSDDDVKIGQNLKRRRVCETPTSLEVW